jgi:hypothetical protein
LQEVTYHVKFVAEYTDGMGYTTYVFERYEYPTEDDRFVMCVRFPNWDQPMFSLGDEGYLNVRFVEAGIDKWFDGKDFNTYKYTNVIFMKFIRKKESFVTDQIIID